MRYQKRRFNELLLRYKKYVKKLQRLQATGRNEHRQSVIRKHIERLSARLNGLYFDIKKATAIAAVAAIAIAGAPEASAQAYDDGEEIPYVPTYLGDTAIGDIDGDGDEDMVVYRSIEGRSELRYFLNQDGNFGAPFAISMNDERERSARGPIVEGPGGYDLWGITLADVDGDGDLDLWAGEYLGRFIYFENYGDEGGPGGGGIFGYGTANPFGITGIDYYSAPAFADLDGDGDLDLMSGSKYGQFYYYENVQQETEPGSGMFTPYFEAHEGGNNPFGLTTVPYGGSYAYSKIEFVDFDGDGDYDILATEYSGGIYYYPNESTEVEGQVQISFGALQTNPFGFNSAWYGDLSVGDVDGDGDDDVIIEEYYYNPQDRGPAEGGPSFEISYFENTSSEGSVSFQLSTDLPFSITGMFLSPAVGDLDNDDDLDLVVGNKFGNHLFFENVGTAADPDMELVSILESPFSGFRGPPPFVNPALMDLDADGDLDIMTGTAYGMGVGINDGDPGQPYFGYIGEGPYTGSPFNDPTFADLDKDGDLDMFVGIVNYGVQGRGPAGPEGIILYYENLDDETPESGGAVFGEPVQNPFGLDVLLPPGTIRPTFTDVDDDGDLDLMIGSKYGMVLYENTETEAGPSFGLPILSPFGLDLDPLTAYNDESEQGTYVDLVFADVDDDGDDDLLVSSFSYEYDPISERPIYSGGLYYKERHEAPSLDGSLSDVLVQEGFGSTTVDLTGLFSEPDGDALTLSAELLVEELERNEGDPVSVAVSGNTLTITELANGSATVVVTADDGRNGVTTTEFDVTVNAQPDLVGDPIADQFQQDTFTTAEISFTGLFTDEESETLTYTVESSDTDVVTVSQADGTITVTNVGAGTSTITLTVNDEDGGSNTDEFDFVVNGAPTVDAMIQDADAFRNFGSTTQDLSLIFSDPNGDALTFSATSSTEAAVTVGVDGNVLTITEAGLGTSTITVTADDGNQRQTSDDFLFTVNEILGTDDLTKNGIKVYPNPAAHELTVQSQSGGEVKIFDVNGRFQMKSELNETIDISALESGIYFLVINNGKGESVTRIVKD